MRVLSRLLLALALTFVGGAGFVGSAAPAEAACCEDTCPCPCPPPTPARHRPPAAAAPAVPAAPAPAAARKVEPRTEPRPFAAFVPAPEAHRVVPPLTDGRGRDPDLSRHLARLSLHRI
jgi:hypothetical protein